MPAVTSPAKVLVTGANGFLGAWIVRTLLARGYYVVGTVRTAEKGKALKSQFLEKEGGKADRFEYAVVPDLAVHGACDHLVKDVYAVVHTASNMNIKIDDPADYIEQTKQHYLGILEAVRKHGKNVRRIVITGSDASAMTNEPEPKLFDGSEFNNDHVKVVEEKGKDAPPMTVYMASKVISEQAAWDWYEKHKDKINFDLVVLLPCMFFGPLADDVRESLDQNPSTNAILWYALCTPDPLVGTPLEFFDTNRNYVDVREVAEAHVRALEIDEAGGNRFIIGRGPLNWQEWIDVANTVRPDFPGLRKKKDIGTPKGTKAHAGLDTTKAESILGMKWRSVEEILADTLDYFTGRGWTGHAAT